jgi:hypothetical protein
MTEQAIVVSKQPSAVAPWADRGEVRELAERLQTMIPGGQKLTHVEALTLAQAAVAHGLDPFNGELWFLKDKQGKPMGLMAGIKGHRRSAHRQMREEGGGNYWPEFEGPLSVDEKAAVGIPKDALAYRCKIRDTQTVDQYVSQIERLMKTGLPWEIVEGIVGKKPFTEGIGFAQPSERSKMTLVQRAQKRAEADALKRRFDLPFGIAVGMNGDAVIEGEFVVEEDDAPRISQKAQEQALEYNRNILRGDPEEREGLLTTQGNNGNSSISESDAPPSLDDYIARWEKRVAEAKALGLKPNGIELTDDPEADKLEIVRRGKELAAQIAAAKAETKGKETDDASTDG